MSDKEDTICASVSWRKIIRLCGVSFIKQKGLLSDAFRRQPFVFW